MWARCFDRGAPTPLPHLPATVNAASRHSRMRVTPTRMRTMSTYRTSNQRRNTCPHRGRWRCLPHTTSPIRARSHAADTPARHRRRQPLRNNRAAARMQPIDTASGPPPEGSGPLVYRSIAVGRKPLWVAKHPMRLASRSSPRRHRHRYRQAGSEARRGRPCPR